MLSSVATTATPQRPVLKRSLTDFDTDSNPLPSSNSPTKRMRVQFSSDNKTITLKDWADDKTLTLVKEEVKRALQRHQTGESAQYDGLREILTTKPTAADAAGTHLLKRYVIALTGLSSLMGRKCGSLVNSIMDIEWLGQDEEFINLFRRLLATLISSYGGYANDIFESLVDRFTNLRASSGRVPDLQVVTRKEMLDRLHATTNHILYKIPSAVGTLKSVIQENFPHSSDTLKEHVDFVTNILQLTSYAPYLKADIIALIIERLAKVDVQTQVDIEELEEDLQEELEDTLFKEVSTLVENEEDGAAAGDVSDSDDESVLEEFDDPAHKRLKELKDEVAKMDAMMDLLFAHYQPIFSKASIFDQEAALDQIIAMFTRTILPTYRSRHIQFLLFHFAQASEHLSERFVQALVSIILERNQPTMYKRSAAAYLASFIARGARVNRDLVQSIFNVLSKELNRLRNTHEQNHNCGPDLQRFGVYYTIFQALLYIFCFRWRDLLADELEDDNFDVEELQGRWPRVVVDTYSRNIASKMNPLKVCAPAIVNQFAVVSRQLQVLYINDKILMNKRIRLTGSTFGGSDGIALRESALTAKTGESVFQLDAYFPFDPYLLPVSKRWLNEEYNSWKPVPGMGFENQESDSEEEEDEEDEEEKEYDEPTETESVGSR